MFLSEFNCSIFQLSMAPDPAGTLKHMNPAEMGRGPVCTVTVGVTLSSNAPVIPMDCKENIRPHNPKVGSSNLPPATKYQFELRPFRASFLCPGLKRTAQFNPLKLSFLLKVKWKCAPVLNRLSHADEYVRNRTIWMGGFRHFPV